MTKGHTTLPNELRLIQVQPKDSLGNVLSFDYLYELTNGSIGEALNYLKNKFGSALCLTPMGGLSAGGNVFSLKTTEDCISVGLIMAPPAALSGRKEIKYSITEDAPSEKINSQEIHINRNDNIVYAGAGVTLEQINASVQDALGHQFQVQGSDITSKGYASAGATFMTGGMGPSRINFGKNVSKIIFNDGQSSIEISDKKELNKIVETYGWAGLVESVVLPIVEFPQIEFGFALPINNLPKELGEVVAHFSKNTSPLINQNIIKNTDPFITGMEIITKESLSLLYKTAPTLAYLHPLLETLKKTGKNAIVFISGFAQTSPLEDQSDPLRIFSPNQNTNLLFEDALPFDDLQAMTTLREGAPDLARSLYSDYQFTYKNHTDINIRLNKKKVNESMLAIMKCYETYFTKIDALLKNSKKLKAPYKFMVI